MKVLIAGGRGFLGRALAKTLGRAGHSVWVLTRRRPQGSREIRWGTEDPDGWASSLNEMDVVVNAAGYGLEHWPWTPGRKRRFVDSRVTPGRKLVAAIEQAGRRPKVFVQISGINYYGLRGDGIADESTGAASDFLARLTVQWEAATSAVELHGVRRLVARTAVVLSGEGGLLPLMTLPARLFIGGRLGTGQQALNWIHITDWANAIVRLVEREDAKGIYNLVAPTATSNDDFMRSIARALDRPYWLPTPDLIMRMLLGEMSGLVADGRFSRPKRLLELGYVFEYATIQSALENLIGRGRNSAGVEF